METKTPAKNPCVFCQYALADKADIDTKSKILYEVLLTLYKQYQKNRYQDEKVVAFNDIYPQAEVHILVVPRSHIKHYGELKRDSKEDYELINHMKEVGLNLLKKYKPEGQYV